VCRPNAPFAELLKLSQSSIAEELNLSGNRTVIGESEYVSRYEQWQS
jgi:hypothetical protein